MQLYGKKIIFRRKSLRKPIYSHAFTNHFSLYTHRKLRGQQNANERSRDQQAALFRR